MCNHKLENGSVYTGRLSDRGQPYGFGYLSLPDNLKLYAIFSEDSEEPSQFRVIVTGQNVVNISLEGSLILFSRKGPDYSDLEGIFMISDNKVTGFGTISQTQPLSKYKGYLVNGRK